MRYFLKIIVFCNASCSWSPCNGSDIKRVKAVNLQKGFEGWQILTTRNASHLIPER